MVRWKEVQQLVRKNLPLRLHGNLGPLNFGMATLLKWEVFRHTEYSAILLLDDDIDLFLDSGGALPPSRSKARDALDHAWSVTYPRFLRSKAHLIASTVKRWPRAHQHCSHARQTV